MDRKIINGSYRDYIFLFGKSRTAYSDLYAKKSAAEKRLYIMLEENFPAGYICTTLENGVCFVHHAYTVPEKRRDGVFTALLKYLIGLEDNSAIVIQGSANNGQSRLLMKICTALGFQSFSVNKTSRADWQSLCYWKENFFDKFMAERGNKYLEYFSRQGFKIYSFEDSPPEYLEQIYNSRENYFGNVFDVRKFFDGADKNLLARDLSFLTVKNDEAAAYYLTIAPDKKNLIAEQTSVAKKYLNSGLLFPLINKFVAAICKRQFDNLAFAVYEDNLPARRFYEKFIGQLKTSNDFIYRFWLKK